MPIALVLRPDGDISELTLTGTGPHTHQFRQAIDCPRVDCVALTDQLDMWIDDDGYDTREINAPATLLARHYGFTWQHYCGPVVLCSVNDQGDSINLTKDQVIALLTRLADIAE